jgi:hypothetical protein
VRKQDSKLPQKTSANVPFGWCEEVGESPEKKLKPGIDIPNLAISSRSNQMEIRVLPGIYTREKRYICD